MSSKTTQSETQSLEPDTTRADPTMRPMQAPNLARALWHMRAGRLGEAESLLARILRTDPEDARAVYYLGIVAARREEYETAVRLFQRALTFGPNTADAHHNLGNALMALDRPDEAVASYICAITLKPDAAAAHLVLAKALDRQGRSGEAIASYRCALGLNPTLAEAHNDFGVALAAQGHLDEAQASFERALEIDPHLICVHNNLANVLAAIKRPRDEALLVEAEIRCHRRLAESPRDAVAYHRLGTIANQRGDYRAAEAWLDCAVALAPDFAEAHARFAAAMDGQGKVEQAIAQYQRALALKADYAAAHNNLGVLLKNQGRLAEAVVHYERTSALMPDSAEVHYNVGQAFGEQGRLDRSLALYQQALELNPNFAPARFALCMGQLPILYRSVPEVSRRRAAYEEQLRGLCDYVGRHPNPGELGPAVGSNQPFYLAYEGRNDRDLQSQYGALVCRIMGARHPQVPLPPPPVAREPIRLGIVSGFFHRHSNWKIPIKGWLSRLDRQAFRVFGYAIIGLTQ